MAVGGSIQELTLKGRRFVSASDADVSMKLGGFENEVKSNGDGTSRTVKTRVPFKLDGVQVEIDTMRGDQEYLQSLADGMDSFPLTITLVNGKVYQGTGQITGEITVSTMDPVCTLTLEGGATLTIA